MNAFHDRRDYMARIPGRLDPHPLDITVSTTSNRTSIRRPARPTSSTTTTAYPSPTRTAGSKMRQPGDAGLGRRAERADARRARRPDARRLVEQLTASTTSRGPSVPFKRGGRLFLHAQQRSAEPAGALRAGRDRRRRRGCCSIRTGSATRRHHCAHRRSSRARTARCVAYGAVDERQRSPGDPRPRRRVGATAWIACDWAKFAAIAWTTDGSGFYYTRFPAARRRWPPGDENYFNRSASIAWATAVERPAGLRACPISGKSSSTSRSRDDDRWVVITAFQGSSDKSEVYLLDRARPETTSRAPLFTGSDVRVHVHRARPTGGCSSGRTAARPCGRIVAVDPEAPSRGPAEVVGEQRRQAVRGASIAGESLVAVVPAQRQRSAPRCSISTDAPQGEIASAVGRLVSGLDGQPGQIASCSIGFTVVHAPARPVIAIDLAKQTR